MIPQKNRRLNISRHNVLISPATNTTKYNHLGSIEQKSDSSVLFVRDIESLLAGFPLQTKKDSRTNVLLSLLNFVGVTRFELATTRPPDVYSNRAELHPELCRLKTLVRFRSANIETIFIIRKFLRLFFHFFIIYLPLPQILSSNI